MQTFKCIPLILGTLLCGVLADAQKIIDITNADARDVVGEEQLTGIVGGQVIEPVKYVRLVQGSPYFLEDWSPGSLLLSGGKVISVPDLRLDLLRNEIHYKDRDGREMIATTSIHAVTLNSSSAGSATFVQGTPWKAVDKALDGAWLQVLVNDHVSLLRQIRKKLNEETPYGGSTAEQTITDLDLYYVQMNGRLDRIRDWSDLTALFADKKQQIAAYIKTNHLKGRSFTEYAQVVNYYNSLLNAQKLTKV